MGSGRLSIKSYTSPDIIAYIWKYWSKFEWYILYCILHYILYTFPLSTDVTVPKVERVYMWSQWCSYMCIYMHVASSPTFTCENCVVPFFPVITFVHYICGKACFHSCKIFEILQENCMYDTTDGVTFALHWLHTCSYHCRTPLNAYEVTQISDWYLDDDISVGSTSIRHQSDSFSTVRW